MVACRTPRTTYTHTHTHLLRDGAHKLAGQGVVDPKHRKPCVVRLHQCLQLRMGRVQQLGVRLGGALRRDRRDPVGEDLVIVQHILELLPLAPGRGV